MSYEPEEFIHGPNMQMTPDYFAFFINADPYAHRVRDVYRATRKVTDRAYLIDAFMRKPEADGDSHVIGVDAQIESVLAPMILVPPLQLITARAMRILDCEETHPLFARFERLVHCKTEDYDDVMARKLAEARHNS